MAKDSVKKWEFLPDERRWVDISRCRLSEGWLVHACAVGGDERFGGLVYYPDPGHEWKPLEKKESYGTHRCLPWAQLKESPQGFGARLEVPGGWLVFFDPEKEGSVAQLLFCPDAGHVWTDR